MHTKLAFFTDTHFGPGEGPTKRGDLADLLTMQAVQLINKRIKPDAVIFGGDMIDDPENPSTGDRYARMLHILDDLEPPCLFLPGNHDMAPAAFYEIFPRPQPITTVRDVKMICCIDDEAADHNATRRDEDIALIGEARQNHDGPIVVAQHVPCFPTGLTESPYNLTNAERVVVEMETHEVALVLSGHYHAGFDAEQNGVRYVSCPALCRAPFAFCDIAIGEDQINVLEHTLIDAV